MAKTIKSFSLSQEALKKFNERLEKEQVKQPEISDSAVMEKILLSLK